MIIFFVVIFLIIGIFCYLAIGLVNGDYREEYRETLKVRNYKTKTVTTYRITYKSGRTKIKKITKRK